MKVVVYSTKHYDRLFFERINTQHGHELVFLESRLTEQTVSLAGNAQAVCVFVNDIINRAVIQALVEQGVKLLALRAAGFNNVDLNSAQEFGLTVVRVPAYSPHAVAEHTLALVLTLNRKTHRAYNRVREGNFSLDGLMGFDLCGHTVGVIGTGKIGAIFARIMCALGCHVLAYDVNENQECRDLGVEYVPLSMLFQQSDIISLHCPLNDQTRHLINAAAIEDMKKGVMIINTGRGALIDTRAVIQGLKSEKVGYLGLDVYEEETELFFEDLSAQVIQDDVFARLLTFPNVLITGHQGFFTNEAMMNIASTTLNNITAFESGQGTLNTVPMPR